MKSVLAEGKKGLKLGSTKSKKQPGVQHPGVLDVLGYGDLGLLPSTLDVFALFQSFGHSKQTVLSYLIISK